MQLTKQAALCNVSVELKVWQNMIHCHHLFAPMLEEGRQALMEAGHFLQRYLNEGRG